MSIEDQEARINRAIFERLGVPATFSLEQGTEPVPCQAVVDTSVAVRDPAGIIIETRCEIGVPADLSPRRGSTVTVRASGKTYALLKLIENDTYESRWVAVPQ